MSAAVRSSRPAHRTGRTHENVLAALSDVVEISSDDHRRQQDSYATAAHAYSPPDHSHSFAYSGAVPMTTAEPPLSSMPSPGNVASRDDPLNSASAPPVPSKSSRSYPSQSLASDHLHTQQDQQAHSQAKTGGMAGKFANAFRRQTAEEKEAKKRGKAQKNGEVGRSNTLQSSRMDVIDKLDASGIHGSSLFHHDSPYDACTPHANSSQRAPVKAFDPNTDPMTGLSISGGPGNASRPPRNRTVSDSDGKTRMSAKRTESGPIVADLPFNQSNGHGAHVSSARHDKTNFNHYAPSDSTHDNASVTTTSDLDAASDRRGSAAAVKPNSAMAAMWGVQDDEPWQDFAAPKSSPRNQKGGKRASHVLGGGVSRRDGGADSSHLGPYAMDGRDGRSSATSSVLDMEAVMTGQTAEEKRRAAEGYAAPSQEIAGVSPFPEPDYDQNADGGAATGVPKRNKSILRRIKSARQNPNVPPPSDEQVEMSSRAATKRYGPNSHRGGPASPLEGPRSASTGRDWSGLTSPNLGTSGAGSGTSSGASGNGAGVGAVGLGRNGTRRATPQEQSRYHDASEGFSASQEVSSARYGAAVSAPAEAGHYTTGANAGDAGYFGGVQSGSNSARTPSEAISPGGGAGLGRSGSVFGRFGRKVRTPGY